MLQGAGDAQLVCRVPVPVYPFLHLLPPCRRSRSRVVPSRFVVSQANLITQRGLQRVLVFQLWICLLGDVARGTDASSVNVCQPVCPAQLQ